MTVPILTHPCPPYTVSVNPFNGPPSVAGARKHAADDFSQDEQRRPMPFGADLICPMERGVIRIAGWGDGNTGYMVTVYDRESGLEVRVLHLKDVVVRAGQTVTRRQLLAHCNSTGKSTGTHAHVACWFDTLAQALEVQPDPEPVYGRWAVNPSLLIKSSVPLEEEGDMFIAAGQPSNRCALVGAVTKVYIGRLDDLLALIAAGLKTAKVSDGFYDTIP